MTIREQMEALKTYQGCARRPADFEAHWQERWALAAPKEVQKEPAPFHNSMAVYETLTIATGAEEVRARYLRPADGGHFPTVLLFHDLGRGVRGWHHMTRFIALGYAVLALENRMDAGQSMDELDAGRLERCYLDALVVAQAALALSHTDAARLATWGEGFGGALAVIVAALLPMEARCAALHLMPADFRGRNGDQAPALRSALDYLDAANFAPLLRGSLLLGTGLLDKTAPPEGQYTVYNRAVCPKRHLVYPKYEHERINFFENELIKFLHL